MIAYRVEHKDAGCGPYNIPIDAFEDFEEYWDVMDIIWKVRSSYSQERHLGPLKEWGAMPPSTYVYGFSSLEQLLEWFDDEHARKGLASAGFVVRTYEMSNFMAGQVQIAFEKFSAKPLTTLSLVG